MTHRLLRVLAGCVCLGLLICGLIYLMRTFGDMVAAVYRDDPLTYLRTQAQNLTLTTASILGVVACEYLTLELLQNTKTGDSG